ncbi:response regulator transcription factor [Clostridium sporogenes]|uniref:response regulator transcription factor n=1 Tax=Clostridium sporogenes TaxID=1509 RepID=UPI0013D28658|nr:response regulator transcription factor [Clostridium sporogenes]EKS4343851.1 response regulator transcription factor [Clostridium botulinum]EKS4396261.1 response regulator transcription factor [Clostridium botulinum]NFG95656.1 response regulator transcription factor [Clostridium sporogenes]NFH32700.1 response regulator transcription factor [Clostridium sporogenes]NFL18854.1 response regulator transcription factor [Clostridium sporogenes]
MKKVLVVEDQIAIRELIAINLEMAGYEVIEASDGEMAVNYIENTYFDIILLDIMLPKLDGFSIISKIKGKGIPVIFVTAKDDVLDRVKGLKLGADDYITKPFESIELLARIEAVLRRCGKIEEVIKLKHLDIFPEQRLIKSKGEIIDITLKEYELLMLFIKNKNIALSRDQILERVWGYDYFGETRTVDIHVLRIREKLNLKDCIKTVYKVGYRLED